MFLNYRIMCHHCSLAGDKDGCPITMELCACIVTADEGSEAQDEIVQSFNIAHTTINRLLKKLQLDGHLIPCSGQLIPGTHKCSGLNHHAISVANSLKAAKDVFLFDPLGSTISQIKKDILPLSMADLEELIM